MPSNPDSILDVVKKAVGFEAEYTTFDTDLIMHINTVLSTLRQLGIGPDNGFSIQDNTSLWSDFSSDMTKLAGIKSYVYLKVRMAFDPPATSFAIAAIEKQLQELEFRLNVAAEEIRPPSDPFGA